MVNYLDHKNLANTRIDPCRAREIAEAVARCRDQVREAESAAGRPEGSVRTLVATKTRDIGEIMAAIGAGVRLIGENRPQEIQIKAEGIAQACRERGFEVESHLIGQLQKNKINKVVPWVDAVESVDSAEQARQIAQRLAPDQTMKVFLEVNESGEESKSGCDPAAAYDEASAIAEIPSLELVGLMTIGTHVEEEAPIRRGFAALRELRDRLRHDGGDSMASCEGLSMGMTHDFPLAIAEGATEIRVGSAIFGERLFV